MENVIGYVIDPRTIKDMYGEYRLTTPLSEGKFYKVSGELTDRGLVVSNSIELDYMSVIYNKAIKIKGIARIRGISIALSFESLDSFYENPYICILSTGIGFDTIDKLAKSIGFKDDDAVRLVAMVYYKLMELGNTLWTLDEIENEIGKSISLGLLDVMGFDRVEGTDFYVLKMVKEAVNSILSKIHRIECISGTAGTGKTTTLVNMYNSEPGYVVAFTAKAANRVNEVMGKKVAVTIHRLIASEPNPISVLYIDESSMVNVLLLGELFNKVDALRYVMIGDYNQLPAIGCGSPFVDLVRSSKVNSIKLDRIYRTDSEGILSNAKYVLDKDSLVKGYKDFKLGNVSDLDSVIVQNTKAMYLTFTNSQRSKINSKIRKVVNSENKIVKYKFKSFAVDDKVMHLKNNYQFDVFNSDMGKVIYVDEYCIGVEYEDSKVLYYMDSKLNCIITDEPEGRKLAECGAGILYKRGWYHYLVTNKSVESSMNTVDLAYCLTVHKAQGSEADNVVICVDSNAYLSNQWLYTAITRAKVSCNLLASSNTIEYAINNYDGRITYMSYALENL